MTTREMYAVCSEGLITVGLSVDTPGQWPDGIRALCADTQSRGGTLDEFEAAVKRRWPGRPYWIEWGDDHNWVQVVEFGAFENKEHKRVRNMWGPANRPQRPLSLSWTRPGTTTRRISDGLD